MPEPDLDLLTQAAQAAGEIAMKHFRESPDYWDKGDGQGPVSEADLAVNTMLEAELRAARPDYGWLSEETADSVERLSRNKVFIVDPIDGTRSFLAGHENFSHSLAIVEDGQPVAAAVHLPAKDMTFAASENGPATLNGKEISAGNVTDLDGASALAAKPMMRSELWPGGVPPVDRHFRSSLAYRLCIVANGRFDAMFTFRDAWEWDVAAGDLICRRAGADVYDKNGAAPRYNNPGAKLPGIIASAPGITAALMARAIP
ncbi:MAG: 3'(2'),5'-bisphosphate nucleotidase CysQ [Pseudomonadota bacterium]